MSHGWQKRFSFGQAKYSAGIMHLCRGCKPAYYPCKALKNPKKSSILRVQRVLVRGSGGMPSESASAGYPHFSTN